MICSIVREVDYGAVCSYPPGKREVYFLAPYRPCLHSTLTAHDVRLSSRGRDEEETRRQARELAQTFQNCCYVSGIRYYVEEFQDEDDVNRAPNGEFTR